MECKIVLGNSPNDINHPWPGSFIAEGMLSSSVRNETPGACSIWSCFDYNTAWLTEVVLKDNRVSVDIVVGASG